jgi:hypothetical protein
MQVVSWIVVKINCLIDVGALSGSVYSYIMKMHGIKIKIQKNSTLYSGAGIAQSI